MFPHKGVGVPVHVEFAFVPVNGNGLPAYFLHRKNLIDTDKAKNRAYKGVFFHGYLQNLVSSPKIRADPGAVKRKTGSSLLQTAGRGFIFYPPWAGDIPAGYRFSGGLLRSRSTLRGSRNPYWDRHTLSHWDTP
jgi:hypothetical protein